MWNNPLRRTGMHKKIILPVFIVYLVSVACGGIIAQPTQVVLPTLEVTTCPVYECPTCEILPTDLPVLITDTPDLGIDQPPIEYTVEPSQEKTVEDVTPTQGIIPTEIQTDTPTPISTETPVPFEKVYQLQLDPVWRSNIIYPEKGCNWMSVVGQVFDQDGNPVKSLIVLIKGVIANQPVEVIGMTGAASAYKPYGAYETTISDKPFDSDGNFTITLFDINWKQLSDSFPFKTLSKCDTNLIIINFITIKK